MIKPNQLIVFEGDSNTSRRNPPCMDTWAYLRMNNWHISYADRVEEWLLCNCPELKTRVRNSAVGGSSIRGVLARFDGAIAAMKPDWLILTLHANDATQKIPLDEFRDGLLQLNRRLKEHSGRLVWVDTGRDDDTSEYGATCRPYRQTARSALEACEGIIIPAGNILAQKEAALKEIWPHHTVRTGEDGHLNLIAAEIVSTLVLEALGMLKVLRAQTLANQTPRKLA